MSDLLLVCLKSSCVLLHLVSRSCQQQSLLQHPVIFAWSLFFVLVGNNRRYGNRLACSLLLVLGSDSCLLQQSSSSLLVLSSVPCSWQKPSLQQLVLLSACWLYDYYNHNNNKYTSLLIVVVLLLLLPEYFGCMSSQSSMACNSKNSRRSTAVCVLVVLIQ
jgi:hypothetical protein